MITPCEQAAGGGPAAELLDGSVRSPSPALQTFGRVQRVRRPAGGLLAWRGGPMPGWPPAPGISQSRQHRPRADRGAARNPIRCATIEREVDFDIDVYAPKSHSIDPLGDVSPVVRGLGVAIRRLRQASSGVRSSRMAADLQDCPKLPAILDAAIDRTMELETRVPMFIRASTYRQVVGSSPSWRCRVGRGHGTLSENRACTIAWRREANSCRPGRRLLHRQQRSSLLDGDRSYSLDQIISHGQEFLLRAMTGFSRD